MTNFADHIVAHGLHQPGKAAIILRDRLVTYGMLLQGVLSAQQKIKARGIAGPLLAAIVIDNPVRHLIMALALARLGIAATSLTEHQLEKIPDIGISVYFCDNLYHRALSGKNAVLVTPDWFATTGLALDDAPGFPDDDHACRISFSSGTTGIPKAIAMPAGGLTTQLTNRMLISQLVTWDRLLTMTGMSSDSGLRTAFMTLWMGHTLLLPSSAQEALQLISVYGVEFIACSTQQLRVMLECQAEQRFSCDSVKLVRVGGSAVPPRLVQEAQKLLCQKVLCSYSATETGTTAYALADTLPDPRSAGRVAAWAKVQTVDEENRPLPPGTPGRLRSNSGTAWSYFSKGDSLVSLRGSDWLYSGDEGLVTPDGWLLLTGRTSEIINSGGVKLAPYEIEEFLIARPDIVDAAALGMRGETGVEELWLAIVAGPDFSEENILRACIARDPNVVPERVLRVATIPRSATGKIQREPLKAALNA